MFGDRCVGTTCRWGCLVVLGDRRCMVLIGADEKLADLLFPFGTTFAMGHKPRYHCRGGVRVSSTRIDFGIVSCIPGWLDLGLRLGSESG